MKLPHASLSIVERRKITDYLLNTRHRIGAAKARFFIDFGFDPDTWKELAAALREHGASNRVTRVTETGFGRRYEVEGALFAPDGRRPLLRTVWQMDEGQFAPRLITAYPLEP